MRTIKKPIWILIVMIIVIVAYFAVALTIDLFHHKTKYDVYHAGYISWEALDKIEIEAFVGRSQKEFLVDDSYNGIMNITISDSFSGEIKDAAKGEELSVYDDFTLLIEGQAYDGEVTVFPAEYMRWIDAAGYGWLNDDGNLYAQMFGAKAAEGKPNYRNKFSFVARIGSVYYQVTGFCDTRDFELFIKKAVELINENFAAEQE